MVGGVVSLANDHVQMRLSTLLGVADALLENLLGFFDVLAVQVDGIAVDFAHGVVLAKDKLRGLLVVLVGFGSVRFALLRQLFRFCAITSLVCLLGACGEMLVLALLFTSEVTETVVFLLGISRRAVVEG